MSTSIVVAASGAAGPTTGPRSPVTNIASVESMNGAPRIAPTPTSCDDAPVAKRIAMIGIIVSGQRGADRGEDRADGALGQLELAPEPLDAVGEELGADEDDDEGEDEDRAMSIGSGRRDQGGQRRRPR